MGVEMKSEDFKCPYCGSTYYRHVFPKDKTIPVFLRLCGKCGKYKIWIHKRLKKEKADE